jgi:hypothetical protein
MSESRTSLSLFNENELDFSVGNVTAVNSVDIYNISYPDFNNPGKMVEFKNFVDKGDYIIHSSGAHHAFKNIHHFRSDIPKYFREPVFPWIQSRYIKRKIVPGIPQSKEVYPYVGLGKKKKKPSMHRLVAAAFLPREEGKTLVSHKNNMKWDYRPKNLEWNTPKGNSTGPEADKRIDLLTVYDACMEKFKEGINYKVFDYEDEEEFYL